MKKETFFVEDWSDIAIIGGGHAGIEAALASSRMGLKTTLFTLSLDAIGNMPCNPSIGGTAKGHLVYEIDALGGEMGVAADKVTLQSRTLNLGKGPAVHSKRVQADRAMYHTIMKKTLENTPLLRILQAEVTNIDTKNNEVCGIITKIGGYYPTKAAVFCCGTYLRSRIIIGDTSVESGADAHISANELTSNLVRLGIEVLRFKTGTPPRIHMDSIDYSKLESQPSENEIIPFSYMTDYNIINSINQIPCYIAYTNKNTHEIIRKNLHRSPLYGGKINGVGARYCPSIEDKIVRFSDKPRHQLFVEPLGSDTKEIYLQGFSSSLPADVQLEALHSITGFEKASIMRYAYAIEYDCINPKQLLPTLEFKKISGLYGAGQFNGTSGYEEAAAQGLIAGINAALKIKGEPPLVLTRNNSYIGTLIDDIVVKGTNEPYRMMTSRSEFRLLLRQDNAAFRLMDDGLRIGLLPEHRFNELEKYKKMIENEIKRLKTIVIPPSDHVNELLKNHGSTEITSGVRFSDLIKRPELNYEKLEKIDDNYKKTPKTVKIQAEIQLKYDGYINRQLREAKVVENLSRKILPQDIDYNSITGLRIEARQKLNSAKPLNLGQASAISGVSPSDISVLLIWLKINKI